MTYTEKQQEIADFILIRIRENGSYIDRTALLSELQDKFGYDDVVDMTLLFLERDGYIVREGRVLTLSKTARKMRGKSLKRMETEEELRNRVKFWKAIAEIALTLLTISATLNMFLGCD